MLRFEAFKGFSLKLSSFYFLLDVRGKVAGSLCPLDGRFGVGLAIDPRYEFHCTIAPFAGLHDGIAPSTVVGTAVLLHEDTFCSLLDSLANHDNQPPFIMNFYLYVITGFFNL